VATTKETERLAKKIYDEIIPASCNGNKSAEGYLRRVFFIVRLVDDLQDGDVAVSKEDITKAFFILIADLPNNDFYKKYADVLMGVHIVSFNAWQDANLWEKDKNDLKRIYAHVLRDYICELFALVAYLTGGRKLMREISLKVREVFLKKLSK